MAAHVPPSTSSASEPEFVPYVPADVTQRELSIRGVVLGSVLGIVFAASSVYLGLKIGLTVSASIPVAVLSITLFRWAAKAFKLRQATVLENNIVQTTGSAGESIAAGIAFTLPSLLIMGFEMELGRILMVGLLGGLIGVLMMIPLRHGLMVKEHKKLAFPEGTACADVLIVGEQGGANAKTVFLGFGVGFGYMILNAVFGLWKEAASFAVTFWGKLKGATLAFEVSPAMLGVGYIIGPKTSANMLAGGALAFLVLVPLIHHFGDGLTGLVYPATDMAIADMSAGDIRNNYILFIGAGAVATGGFIALARAIPTIVAAFRRGLGNLSARAAAKKGAAATAIPRTERDLSMRVVLGGSLALALAIAIAPFLDINPLSAILIVLFGFFFVTVSSRITGEIGSSSNPISGMTVATLLLTCGLFVAIGWTGVEFKAMALTTAALVCVAASNGGTIAQDLKTGHLVGATPRAQQISILVGVISSAIVIGFVLQLLNEGAVTYKAVEVPTFTLAEVKQDPVHGLHVSATEERIKGPDDVEYGVVYLHEQVAGATRGKYLVDPQGKLAFFVDPGVCGTYPYTLERPQKATALAIASDAQTEHGTDRKAYKLVNIKRAELPAGTWLVADDGQVRAQIVKKVVDSREQDVVEEARYDGIVVPVPAGTARENVALKQGELVLQRVTTTAPIAAGAGEGRYLVAPDASDPRGGQVAWITREDVSKYDAPKAQLFRLIIDGTLGGELPWGLVLVGVFLAFMMELVGVSSLPFAVGLYLPIDTSAGIFVGGMVRWLVDRKKKVAPANESEMSPGMLMASGLIAGGAIAGIVNAAMDGAKVPVNVGENVARAAELDPGMEGLSSFLGSDLWAMVPFLALAFLLYVIGKRQDKAA